jgi:GH25 family lysozyme M1 (1,4-beta-N-acetylmuramidase)
MNIKQPAAYDVSHWKEIPDFKLVDPRPLLFVTKATEAYPGIGYNHTDDKFIRFFEGMREIGVFRGAYHFFRKSTDATRQAQHFCNTIRPHVVDSDILILDMEEGGERTSQIWAWFEYVKRSFPNNLLLIYSTAGLLNALPMTAPEKEYFRKIPTWTAGYPWFPDWYPSVPAMYIPDQSKWGPVYLWQYSAHGAVAGIQGDVDLNWMAPAFLSLLDDTVTPPGVPPPPPVVEPIPPEPEPQLWNATVLVDRLYIRSYPVVTDASKTVYHANTGEKFTGRLWVGNGYVWILIDTATRPELPGRWAAVRTEKYPGDGTRQLISLTKAVSGPPSAIHTFTVPAVGEFFITRHDYQRADWGYKPRSFALNFKRNPPECALPETVYLPGCKPDDFVPLSRAWQEFWFELLNLASEKSKTRVELLTAWEDLTAQGRAFTDLHSTMYGFTDFITGRNLGGGKGPIQHKSLSCGGNIVKKIGVHSSGKYIIEALDLSKPPPDPGETIQKPWLVHWGTQETVIPLAGGSFRVSRFPQLAPYGTPFLLVSRGGTNLIERGMVEGIRNGATYSPYT